LSGGEKSASLGDPFGVGRSNLPPEKIRKNMIHKRCSVPYEVLKGSIHRYFDILEGKAHCSYCGKWFHQEELNEVSNVRPEDGPHTSFICDTCLHK